MLSQLSKVKSRALTDLTGMTTEPPPPMQVARDCQPLTDICEFLTSDSVEAFVLSYTTLLTAAPGVTPNLLAGLVSARVYTDKHMTKADAREVGAGASAGGCD